MPFEVITSNPGTAYDVDATDTVILPNGQQLTSSFDGFNAINAGPVFSFTNVTLQIFGSIYSGNRAIDFWGSLGGVGSYNFNTIFVGATGVVSGTIQGIIAESGSDNQILNYGLISGAMGIESYGGANSVISNGGSITGLTDYGILVQGEVDTGSNPNTVITNLASGLISGAVSAIQLRDLVGGSSITNYGMISSALGMGIDLNLVSVGQSVVRVMNHGTISAQVNSFLGSANADSLTNRGLMAGAVDMGLGNDTLDNRGGTIEGDVTLGGGNNFLDNRGGTINGTIDGGVGTDTFRPGEGTEVINGGSGSDTVDFRGSSAVVVALDNSVSATGNAAGDEYFGIELVSGSNFADVIVGSSAANTLRGFGGNDTINGGAGIDRIAGGIGIDLLTGGGAGNDVFIFETLSEIGDLITDFGSAAGNHDLFNIRGSAFGGGLVLGTLAAADFVSRADNVAQDATDRFVFRTMDQTLWFDADGNGAGAAVMLADLQAGAVVDRFDIVII